MLAFRIDDTGDAIFESQTELAEFLGCAISNINWHRKHSSDSKNHFYCCGYGINIVRRKVVPFHKTEKGKARQKKYYAEHREYYLKKAKQWRKTHHEKVMEAKEKWRKEHKEWYNAYYREQRKKKKEQTKGENNE